MIRQGALCVMALGLVLVPARARAQTDPQPMAAMPGMDHSAMPGMGHAAMPAMTMNSPEVGMAGISGARGFYPYERDASGTAWQPDASPRQGLRLPRGPWLVTLSTFMQAGYARLDGFQTTQQGFTSGVITAAARRDLENMDVIQLRARIRPNTAVASTFANPRDRQVPSAVASELSGSYSHRLNITDTVFAYAAVVGQPALGPPVFFDRLSSGDSPLAPIYVQRPEAAEAAAGVVTGGWAHGDWKVEGSGFTGRAPLPNRLMTPGVDSWSVRLSLNPTARLSLQTSFAVLHSPNSQLPAINPNIWSTSAIYTRPMGAIGWWSTTVSFARSAARQLPAPLDAWLLESAVSNGPWTGFARAEQGDLRGLASPRIPIQTVRKTSFGAVRDWRLREHLRLGLGGLYALGRPSPATKSAYGSGPSGAMVFLRLRLG